MYEGLLSDITVLLCHPHLPCSRARVDKQVVSVPSNVQQYSGDVYAVTELPHLSETGNFVVTLLE